MPEQKQSSYEKVEGLFVDLMASTIESVLDKIKSGEADSKDIRNAITLLKDNGFTLRDVPMNKDPNEILTELASSLPKLPQIGAYGDIEDGEIDE